MKKILIVLFILFGWISCAFAENFYIENYDVILKIDSYNNINIEENIDVNFTTPSHGIFRTIPFVNNVVRADGKKYKTHAKISNIRTSETNTVSKEDGNYIIKLGNPDVLINKKKSYTLRYNYALDGRDDELYFNIIGTDWDVDIRNVTFKVYMPKAFSSENVGLSIGQYGTAGFKSGAEFSVDSVNNTIEGHTTQSLNPHEGVTIRIQLPKGYFIKKPNYTKSLCCFLITIFTFISFFYWFVFGKDEKVIPVVNFYPPKDFNSALVGLIYSEHAEIEQVVSLIIYLADKGYIRIEDDGISQTLFKLKDYEGKNLECKELMNALFKYGRNCVSSIELETSTEFYKDCEQILAHLDITKNVIYEKDSVKLSTKFPIIFSISALAILLYAILSDFSFNMNLLIPLIFVSVLSLSFINMYTKACPNNTTSKVLTFFFFAFFTSPIIYLIFFYGNVSAYPDLIAYCVIGLIISGVCLYQLPRKNKQGLAILGHILGYKKFLETAQKHELEKLANENPQYYFNMLPYAYVLGVTEVWIKKFENLINNKPDWYKGNFNSTSFVSLTNTFCALSSPSTSNGGISSSSSGGGGCSGGGSGGGGGGSW